MEKVGEEKVGANDFCQTSLFASTPPTRSMSRPMSTDFDPEPSPSGLPDPHDAEAEARDSRAPDGETADGGQTDPQPSSEPFDTEGGVGQQAPDELLLSDVDDAQPLHSAAFQEEVKSYVGSFMDRGLQRRLRSKTRNQEFRKTVVDACASDDIVVVFNANGTMHHWFVQQKTNKLTDEERTFLHNIN